ncbi:phosphodiesterase [Motilimonas pumila]|uniref:Phosphoesterase n=1 Tax=Motilimonas pumila TaxID=2303987 RepID=A0A418YEV5_9GAMM|nr:phosphodiesterase [Motilimonas pumila]RJG47726.1 phosphodiesterase [Motilimonas pumila]
MKLFVISDIHGAAASLRHALEAYEGSGADHLIILGDMLNHGPRNALPHDYDPMAVVAQLNALSDAIIAVRGNCDSEVDQSLLQFPLDASYNQIPWFGRKLFLTHGHLYSTECLPPLRGGDVFCFGHVHVPAAKQQGEIYLFNPGSIAIPRQSYPASYGIITADALEVRALDSGEILQQCSLVPQVK